MASDEAPTLYNSLWARPGLTVAGTGAAGIFDPGTGPERYQAALDLLRSTSARIAFASFTFDPEETGSIVVVPEEITSTFDRSPVEIAPGRIEEDDAERWPKMVGEALVEIDRDRVLKVVLSRRLLARFESAIDPFAVAANLIDTQPDCHVFAIEGLVGASPELLLRIGNERIESTPLAGSATEERADLRTTKNAFEHRLAADSVDAAFRSAGLDYRRREPQIVEVGSLRHLGTRFEGSVPEGFDFADILGRLHPTAAVAGTPRPVALGIIREMEETSRGRYAGPVGWFDRSGNGEFAVALRCGLIENDMATLRSGAGIVAGSDPDDELEETIWKLQPMFAALGLSDTQS